MGLGIARSFPEGPVCHRVSNGHRSSCLVSDYGPANNLEISTTPTLFSMLLNAVSPPPRKPGDDHQENARGWGPRHTGELADDVEGAKLVSNPLIVPLRIRDAVPSAYTPAPRPRLRFDNPISIPLAAVPQPQQPRDRNLALSDRDNSLRPPLPHGPSAQGPYLPPIRGLDIA